MLILLKLLPFVPILFNSLEQSFPQAKLGPFKLGLMLKILGHLWDLISAGPITKDTVLAKIPDIATSIATDLNANPQVATAVVAPAVTA